jgi:hypothetical protein
MFIVSPATALNSAALETRHLPRRFLGRVTLIPIRGVTPGLLARMVFEVELLRYLIALLPFVIGALVWRDSALAIAQAPLLMFLVIYGVEMRFLRIPADRRETLIDPAEADRGLDLLRVRALAILTRIAAGRGLADGALHLVIEQSELARIAPLTFVSVQSEEGPEVLRLDAGEEALIRETLFTAPLTERQLLLINLARSEPLRDIALDLRAVSAHARLAAMMARAATP